MIEPIKQIIDQKTKTVSIDEYTSELAKRGRRVLPGSAGTFWVRNERYAMRRVPPIHMVSPAPDEVRKALWRGPAAVVSYILEPDENHPANAYLYVCADREYALRKLAPPVRRNLRRGLKELKVTVTTPDQVLAYGVQAFRDTLHRNGLGDATPEGFRRTLTLLARCPGHVFLGAWMADTLAAFLSIWEVDDWVEIEGCYSMDALLNLRPNDALMYVALSRYLTEKACRVVSYGLSSIQAKSKKTGLHTFKTKIGYEARPVHRAFVIHPLLRPLANSLTLRTLNSALHLISRNRRLKKAEGILAYVLGENRINVNEK